MVDELHEFELPIGPLRVGDVLEGPRQLLDGHVHLGDGVVGGAVVK